MSHQFKKLTVSASREVVDQVIIRIYNNCFGLQGLEVRPGQRHLVARRTLEQVIHPERIKRNDFRCGDMSREMKQLGLTNFYDVVHYCIIAFRRDMIVSL